MSTLWWRRCCCFWRSLTCVRTRGRGGGALSERVFMHLLRPSCCSCAVLSATDSQLREMIDTLERAKALAQREQASCRVHIVFSAPLGVRGVRPARCVVGVVRPALMPPRLLRPACLMQALAALSPLMSGGPLLPFLSHFCAQRTGASCARSADASRPWRWRCRAGTWACARAARRRPSSARCSCAAPTSPTASCRRSCEPRAKKAISISISLGSLRAAGGAVM